MSPSRFRFLPSLAVAVLLVLVARAQSNASRNAGLAQGECRSVTVTASFIPPPQGGFILRERVVTVTATGLEASVHSSIPGLEYAGAAGIVDPATGDMEASTYPLEHWGDAIVTTSADLVHVFRRPIVLGLAPGDPASPTAGVALRLDVTDLFGAAFVGYEPAGSPEEGPLSIELPSGDLVSPPGPHPVLGKTVCDVDDDARDLVVVQQILGVTGPLVEVTPTVELVQDFVCPTTRTAEWVELAAPAMPTATAVVVAVYDFGASVVPPPGPFPVTTTATTIQAPAGGRAPSWVASFPFSEPVRFEAGHRYWLAVQWTPGTWAPGVHDQAATGVVYPGKLWRRVVGSTEFTPESDLDLSLRLIGTVDHGPPPAIGAVALSEVATPTAMLAADETMRIAQLFTSVPIEPVSGTALLFGDRWGAVSATSTFTAEIAFVHDGHVAPGLYPLAVCPVTQTCCEDVAWRTFTPNRPLVLRESHPTLTADWASSGFAVAIGGAAPPLHPVFAYAPDLPAVATRTAEVLRNGVWEPLGGPGAAFAHRVGTLEPASGATITALLQVLPSEAPIAATLTARVVQTVRVRGECEVGWLELAIPGGQSPPAAASVALMEALPGGPPPDLPVTVTSTLLLHDGTGPAVWMASLPFATRPRLVPGRDYWLVVEAANAWAFGATAVTVTADVTGPLWATGDIGSPPLELQDRTLSYRLIGTEGGGATDVTAGPGVWSPRLLRAEPNPFRGSLAFRWTGGDGKAALEIVDVRGRIVRRVRDAGSARAGGWRWDGRDERGREVPSGVYFARLRDASGERTSLRVVRVH
jgi:hypothetical protein